MKIGVFSFNSETTIRIDRLAIAAEQRGFESLWVPEHTHIPVPPAGTGDPLTGMPLQGVAGSWLEEVYRHMSDPFTSLAAAAAVTRTLRLGTCICLINQHHPVNLAKTVATLDRLADGRLVFGIGAGWYEAEMNTHGVRFADRWAQLNERLAALRALWGHERTAFDGQFVSFPETWQFPKPLRPAGPPVVLGTLDTPFGREQVARHADGWLPLTFTVKQARRSIADVHARMVRHGRDPAALDVSLFLLEDRVQTAEVVDPMRELGAGRLILRLPVADESTVLRVLDHYATFISGGSHA